MYSLNKWQPKACHEAKRWQGVPRCTLKVPLHPTTGLSPLLALRIDKEVLTGVLLETGMLEGCHTHACFVCFPEEFHWSHGCQCGEGGGVGVLDENATDNNRQQYLLLVTELTADGLGFCGWTFLVQASHAKRYSPLNQTLMRPNLRRQRFEGSQQRKLWPKLGVLPTEVIEHFLQKFPRVPFCLFCPLPRLVIGELLEYPLPHHPETTL